MKTVLSLVLGVLGAFLLVSVGLCQNGVITISQESSYPHDTLVWVPFNPYVVLHFSNKTGVPIHTISMGFKISSLTYVGPLRGPVYLQPVPYSVSAGFEDYFDLETSTFVGSNLNDVDTIGFFGRADSTDPAMGLPVGFEGDALYIELGHCTNQIDRVCIDTCSVPPNRPWRWTNTSVTPEVNFAPEFVGLPGQVYQNGEGPDRIGSGYCWRTIGTFQPPTISNCPPGTNIHGTPCDRFVFDFDAQDPEGDPIVGFGIDEGPGQITSTGLWTWADVSTSDTGSYQLEVYPISSEGRGISAVLVVTVTASQAVQLTSGCITDVMLTGDSRQVQMGTTNGACDDNIWSLSQVYGPPFGATCTIDSLGLIQFNPIAPGSYDYRVIVTDGFMADTCEHSFIVHGGSGCCVSQRGNVDGSGSVDLSDLSRMISYMYNANTILGCWDEANVNGSGIIDLTDLSILISYLTVPGSVALANCP